MLENFNYELLLDELSSAQFATLRPAQSNALSIYSANYTATKDLAVELPTGAGKSLISLLIAEVWRREGKKVAILTGNKTLARQMEREAGALGLQPIRMEGPGKDIAASSKRTYHRCQGIAIMNYWVYFNQNPVIDPADLLIMDDAHLAEHCLHSLFSVEINRHAHDSLYETLVTELSGQFPEYSVLQDALDATTAHNTPTELMSFLDQKQASDRIREIVDTSAVLQVDSDLRFRWSRLRNRILEANLYLSTQSIWIRPYIYPLTTNQYYCEPLQRIYMSATIGDPADLARRLGTNSVTKLPVTSDNAAATQGRRMIVMNRIEDEDIPSRLQTAILAALSVHPKSVWLCSSVAEAEHFKQIVSLWLNGNGFVGHPTWILSSLGDEIDEFKAADYGHLFVGGRFDGMDFKADECRLVILATLPRAINLQEEFLTAYLRDSGFMLRRLNHRIIQALGRCNRSEDDFGVYVLADRRFATHFGRESNRSGIPSNIAAEIDWAENATQLGEEEVAKRVERFLSGDFAEFDAELGECRLAIPDARPEAILATSATSSNEVAGWAALYESQDYEYASRQFELCANAASADNLREMTGFFRWCQAKTSYLSGVQGNVVARNTALDVFEQAIECGAKSAWFNRLRSSLNRHRASARNSVTFADYPFVVAQVFDELLEKVGPKGHQFQRWVDKGTRCLDSDSHAEFQCGLQLLGDLLGYSAMLPKYGASTDCRWRGIFGNTREIATFEAKIEHQPSGRITPTAVGQAHNQVTRAKSEYEARGFTVRGTIVSHLSEIDPSAASSLGEVRIIKKDAVQALWQRVTQILARYRDDWDLEDVDARLNAAEQVIAKLPPSAWLSRALSNDSPWIGTDQLLQEWP